MAETGQMAEHLEHEEKFAKIDPAQRILLLPQCLRPSKACPGKFDKTGLVCPEDCTADCVMRAFREEALQHGYAGVCIAAGGKMAVRFVRENGARGILAVACDEELKMGVEAVEEMNVEKEDLPTIVVVPLLKDGCVDTEVDADLVLRTIALRSV
jgi:hypothetical protein